MLTSKLHRLRTLYGSNESTRFPDYLQEVAFREPSNGLAVSGEHGLERFDVRELRPSLYQRRLADAERKGGCGDPNQQAMMG
jgi:hypothetical protein